MCVLEQQQQRWRSRGRREDSEVFAEAAEDVRWLVARLEDAWEDRLSVDVYLWRKDCFLSTSGLAADEVPGLRCLSLHSVCVSIALCAYIYIYIYLCVLVCMSKYVCHCLCMLKIWPMPGYVAV